MMGNITIPELVVLVWAIPSLFFYVFILMFLIRKRKTEPFSAHFYHLFISVGFADVCNSLYIYLIRMPRLWGLIDWKPILLDPTFGPFVTMFLDCGTFASAYTSYFGVLIIAANRYCGFAYPEKWTNKIQKGAILFQWIAAVVVVAPRLTIGHVIGEKNASGYTWATIKLNSVYQPHFYIIYGVLIPLLVNVTVGILYWRMYVHVRNLKRDFGLGNAEKSELRLAWVGVCLFIMMALVEVSIFLYRIIGSTALHNSWLSYLFAKPASTWLVLFALSNPWFLVICSKVTRQSCFPCVFDRTGTNNTVHVHPT